jgi:8-oxo-dGTP pyrophosphatase MutT (NUDIX family)
MEKIANILLYQKGRILLQKRDGMAPRYPNLWGLFGGSVEEGETPLEAALRECKEELDYELTKPILLFEGAKGEGYYGYLYVEEYDENKRLEQKEGEHMQWYEIKELEGLEMIEHDKKTLLQNAKLIQSEIQ